MPLSFGRPQVGLTAGGATDSGTPDPNTPFRILILGDFGGRAAGAAPRPWKPMRIDRDNFEQAPGKLGVELRLPADGTGGPQLTIRVAELDDFHPDHLFRRVEVFRALRELRGRLADPKTFAAAAAEVRGFGAAPSAPEPKPAPPAPAPAPPAEGGGDLISQVMAATAGRAPEPAAPEADDWRAFLHRIVGPHLLPSVDYGKQAELIAVVDDAAGARMRALLHHPAFQSVEAVWQAVAFLVRRLETDENLQLHLLDVKKEELAADLAVEDGEATRLYRLLVEAAVNTPGGKPWAVVAGLLTFDQTPADLELLGRIGQIAQAAGAPFVAAAGGGFLPCDSLVKTPDPRDWRKPRDAEADAAWAALRRRPEAAFLGLATPRLLLRAPYGPESGAAETFSFDEAPAGARHDDYLWGNPAAACVYLLGEEFTHHGWDFRPGEAQEIGGLPLHVYEDGDGERQALPCAEVVLADRAAEAVLHRGLMLLRSIRGQDAAQLAVASVADPPRPLAGRWGES
jgi:type VI secretion system protein ImpC